MGRGFLRVTPCLCLEGEICCSLHREKLEKGKGVLT